MFFKRINQISLSALLLALFVLTTGCDSAGVDEEEPTEEPTMSVEGRATDDSGYSKQMANIEGAVVTAASVAADGSQSALSGQATTDAQGNFRLETEKTSSNVLVLQAENANFSSKVIVYTAGRQSLRAMPMTAESRAEADVYVEARQQATMGATTVGDVAAYVSAQVASEIEAGQTTAADVAAAVRSSAEAEAKYAEENEPDVKVADARGQKRKAFVTLQADLAAASDASAQAAAVEAFEAHVARAYEEAGASSEAQAKASLAGRAALVQMSSGVSANARLALQKRAEVLAARAAANALEATFKAKGAADARLNALQAARAQLLTDLRAATTADEIATARASYQTSVESELAAEFDVDAATLTAAQTGLATAKQALSAAVDAAGSGEAVAKAYAAFYASAEASAKASFRANPNAELAATALVLLSAQ